MRRRPDPDEWFFDDAEPVYYIPGRKRVFFAAGTLEDWRTCSKGDPPGERAFAKVKRSAFILQKRRQKKAGPLQVRPCFLTLRRSHGI